MKELNETEFFGDLSENAKQETSKNTGSSEGEEEHPDISQQMANLEEMSLDKMQIYDDVVSKQKPTISLDNSVRKELCFFGGFLLLLIGLFWGLVVLGKIL